MNSKLKMNLPFLSILKEKKPTAQPLKITADDLDFLRNVLPHGLTKSSLYYQTGGRVHTSLLVFQFPAYLDDLVFAKLFSKLDAVVMLDVSKKERIEQFDEISRSLDELQARGSLNQKAGETLNDQYELQDMVQLHGDLQRGDEHIVTMTLRFFVSAENEAELSRKVKEIQTELNLYNIQTCIPENEMLSEYNALQASADSVAQSVPVYQTFARQYPFYYQSHKDPHGIFFGLTSTGGLVVLDSFLSNSERKSFDMLFTGNKGAGKSATLKSMMQDMVALGHMVMALDVEGELSELAAKLGGVVITPSNPNARMNPLQLRTMFSKRFDTDKEITDEEADESRRANFVAELSRVQSFFYQYVPSLSDTEADEFMGLLEKTYERFGIDGNSRLELLKPADFPIFSDVLSVLRGILYRDYKADSAAYRNGLTETRIRTLERLESALKPLAEGAYSILFNGHSTLNIDQESFVVFDISAIGEMGDRVYNAYLYNVLGLMWSEIYKNRLRNARITNEDDRRYCVAVIDESHKILNARNTQGLEFIEKLVRRARKYDAALWFASQSPRDFAPEGVGGDLEKVKNIFGMVQYKCLLQQDESNADLLTRLFPQFTETEIQSTANFEKGDMILSLGGGRKIRCKRYIPPEDFAYFGGGR